MIKQSYSLCDSMELALTSSLILPPETTSLYVGSYFCDRYFCTTPGKVWNAAFALARECREGAVLVIPTPSQAYLAQVKALTLQLASKYADVLHEIVLNDYAMLQWAQETLPALPRWCGRTMSKDLRDPRYSLPSQEVKLLEAAEKGELWNLQVIGVEADLVTAPAIFRNRQMILAVHLPLAYVTTGRLCEFGSIGKPLHEKFRLSSNCKRQCTDNWLTYENHGFSFLKYGRAVFTSNEHIETLLPPQQLRIIRSALADHLKETSGKEDEE